MVTTTVKKANKETKRNYPYIGEHTGTYVLFVCRKTGTVLRNEAKPNLFNVGQYSEGWEETEFTVFEGEIVLKSS